METFSLFALSSVVAARYPWLLSTGNMASVTKGLKFSLVSYLI